MDRRITQRTGPAPGDIRLLGSGDTIWLSVGAQKRSDWGRYTDAIGHAVGRGAEVRWIR